MNPALATVCPFTVCSKGSRHNNLHNPATFENPNRGAGVTDFGSSEKTEMEKKAGGERGEKSEAAQLEGAKAVHGMKTA